MISNNSFDARVRVNKRPVLFKSNKICIETLPLTWYYLNEEEIPMLVLNLMNRLKINHCSRYDSQNVPFVLERELCAIFLVYIFDLFYRNDSKIDFMRT